MHGAFGSCEAACGFAQSFAVILWRISIRRRILPLSEFLPSGESPMFRRCFLLLIASLILVSPAAAQVEPDKALKTFKVSEGLELSIWAHEPLCVNPTCMDIDHKGRVWYCESINYRQKLRGEKKMR